MADDTGAEEPNPYTTPRFLIAAGVIAIIIALAITLAVIKLIAPGRSDGASERTAPATTHTAIASPSPTPSPSAANRGRESICGLPAAGPGDDGRKAPDVEWVADGTTDVPSAPERYGPGASRQGYRFCFQHSAVGALLASSHALTQSGGQAADVWAEYFVGQGPHRDMILNSDDGLSSGSNGSASRTRIRGYRVLAYSDAAATIDLAMEITVPEGTFLMSGVTELVWQDRDWHYSAVTEMPVQVARIPDLRGYVEWGAV